MHSSRGARIVLKMNHENGGYDSPGCAWPGDRKGLRFDICENGIKHAAWEMTAKWAARRFFAAHAVRGLMVWSDFALEDAGASRSRYATIPVPTDTFPSPGRRRLSSPGAIGDYSAQSNQPLMKHLQVVISPAAVQGDA